MKFCDDSIPRFQPDSEIFKKQVQSTDSERERQTRKTMR